jgi:Pirin
MRPTEFTLGTGMDVRPHPHIGLSTVTYLFEGEIMHPDSLGTSLPIRPGEVNWMTAASGIVHSERMNPSYAQSDLAYSESKAGWRCGLSNGENFPGFCPLSSQRDTCHFWQRVNRARYRRLPYGDHISRRDFPCTMQM